MFLLQFPMIRLVETEFLSFRRRTGEREEAMDDASGSVSAGYDNRGQVFPSEPAGKKVFDRDIDNGEKSLSQSSVTTGEQFLSQHPLFLFEFQDWGAFFFLFEFQDLGDFFFAATFILQGLCCILAFPDKRLDCPRPYLVRFLVPAFRGEFG